MANIRRSRKSGYTLRGGVMRRESLWFFVARTETALAASATAALVTSLNAGALALRPFTIVRTRIKWLAESDQSAASESFVGNYGEAVVSDQAVAIGVTAIPTPATDLGSDLWYLIDQWPGTFSLVGTSIFADLTPKTIDSRAMRKVEEGQDVVGVVEAGIGGNGTSIQVVGRQLIKLH